MDRKGALGSRSAVWGRKLGRSVVVLAALATPSLAGCGADDASTGDQDIVGGVEAANGAFPMVALTDRSGFFKCGGTLVADRWVLTAAHCVDRAQFDGGISKVLIGRHRLSEPDGESHVVTRAIVHPGYDKTTQNNDITLLELATSSSLPKARIAPPSRVAAAAAGVTATAVGWGATREGGSTSDVLRQASVPIIANRECRFNAGFENITGNMICAGFRSGGIDACQGDSGGPLFVNDGGLFQIGIVSFGVGCARPNAPGVYTRIGNYLDWISRNSGGAVPIDDGLGEITTGGVGPIPDATLRSVNEYQVVTELLNCRQSPGTQGAVVRQLPLGTLVRATEEFGRPRIGFGDGKPWLLVRANGSTCYASADFKFITPTSSPGGGGGDGGVGGSTTGQGPIPFSTLNTVDRYQVVTALLNCRQTPGREGAIVTQLPLGTALTATDDPLNRIGFASDGRAWLKVQVNGFECFASADFKFIAPL